MSDEDDRTTVERLTELRDLLERSLQACDPEKRAALSREYRAVLADLERLGVKPKGSAVDQLAARRASRLAASAGSDAAGVSE